MDPPAPSRFGPLMVAAGTANLVAALAWTTNDALFTVALALAFLPPVLFMHVFLAFPSGRLHSPLERSLVVIAYVVAVGLQLVRMTFGGFGPNNLIEVVDDPRAGEVVTRILLTAMGVVLLTGVLVLVVRRVRSGRPLRRSMRLLVTSFALGLVMAAALFLSNALGLPVQQLRWVDVRNSRGRPGGLPDRAAARPSGAVRRGRARARAPR